MRIRYPPSGYRIQRSISILELDPVPIDHRRLLGPDSRSSGSDRAVFIKHLQGEQPFPGGRVHDAVGAIVEHLEGIGGESLRTALIGGPGGAVRFGGNEEEIIGQSVAKELTRLRNHVVFNFGRNLYLTQTETLFERVIRFFNCEMNAFYGTAFPSILMLRTSRLSYPFVKNLL